MLILLQRADATFLRGRKQWGEMGRTVKPRARAVHIYAPKVKAGEAEFLLSFTVVKIYDVSDTIGPPFEVPCVPIVKGDAEMIRELLGKLERWVSGSGLTLRYESLAVNTVIDGATDGVRIWVRPDLSPSERLAVLAHEIAHAKMHFRRKQRGSLVLEDEPHQRLSRDEQELQAELTAFLILEQSGIDSSKGSAGYLNSWKASKGKIADNAEKCLAVACSVLRDCEKGKYRQIVDADGIVLVTEAYAAVA
ncbi:MAG: ImmA/IrrE family metallo-endopeptidase [Myxococcales bacterium]|nr:ImmA/IrrE family metallo-endopeptidase [Myxococcales bacterium]